MIQMRLLVSLQVLDIFDTSYAIAKSFNGVISRSYKREVSGTQEEKEIAARNLLKGVLHLHLDE